VDNITDNREAQCAKALILMSELMQYDLSNDDLDRPFKLLTQVCT